MIFNKLNMRRICLDFVLFSRGDDGPRRSNQLEEDDDSGRKKEANQDRLVSYIVT